MESPKDETERDESAPPAEDVEEQAEGPTDPQPDEPATPKKPKGPDPGEEDSYEDGWYQVLKRRAGGAGDKGE